VQVRHLTTFQDELAVNYCQLAVVSTDRPVVTAAFRAGLGATFTFLSDHERRAITELEIVEQTAPGFEHGLVALPYTFPSPRSHDPPHL
jgi:peroxiredoxin